MGAGRDCWRASRSSLGWARRGSSRCRDRLSLRYRGGFKALAPVTSTERRKASPLGGGLSDVCQGLLAFLQTRSTSLSAYDDGLWVGLALVTICLYVVGAFYQQRVWPKERRIFELVLAFSGLYTAAVLLGVIFGHLKPEELIGKAGRFVLLTFAVVSGYRELRKISRTFARAWEPLPPPIPTSRTDEGEAQSGSGGALLS